MYLKISANREFFNPEEWLKTLLFAPHWLAPRLLWLYIGLEHGDFHVKNMITYNSWVKPRRS